MNAQLQNNISHQTHQPASVRSSQSSASNFRSSNNSTFSQWHSRSSIASTNTTWSHFSEPSREHYISQAERSLSAHSSASYPQSTGPLKEQTPEVQPKRVSQRQSLQEKEQFSTCVSRAKRPRRSTKEPKYWCTSCSEGFVEKYDWKRHEETFQERSEMYECSLCNKYYFLDKDFVHHHQKGHRCKTCADNRHVEIARKRRPSRTGWGCGFCLRFDSDWAERCKHVALHFEKGDNMANWKHAKVIYSLLQQPHIRTAWLRLLDEKQEIYPNFAWNQTDTGRAEGYPDSNRPPQLQDLLEFFTSGQSASALVQLAYEKGHRRQHKSSHSPELMNWIPETTSQRSSPARVPQLDYPINPLQQSGSISMDNATSTQGSPVHTVPIEKKLPMVPSGPPVPPKDHRNIHSLSNVQDPIINFESWSRLTSTIPEDDVLPDSVPMNVCQLGFDTFDNHFEASFHHLQ